MTSEEIQAIFFVECEESLVAAEAGLAACKDGTQDADTVNAIFRAVHSIKGGAGAFGYTALQAYTHTFETLLSDVRDGILAVSEPLVDVLLRALDTLTDHVASARDNSTPPEDAGLIAEMTAAQTGDGAASAAEPVAEVATAPAQPETAAASSDLDFDLDSMLDSIVGDFDAAEPAAPAPSPSWKVHIRPHAGAMGNGGEPLLLLREVEALGGECVACETSSVPLLDELNPQQGYLGWTFLMPGSVDQAAVQDIYDFVGDDCDLAFGADATIPAVRLSVAAPPAPVAVAQLAAAASVSLTPVRPTAAAPANDEAAKPAAGQPQVQSIRIDLPKLDRLIDSVGELVIAQAMMAQRLASEGIAASEELALLDGLTRDIQESAMSIRAQPIGSVFSRVPRILRELASSTGKQVKLELIGEATELDKTVIERLGEPLTHLIRNAVDHGIETVQERLAAGKPAEGTLVLAAEHRSGRILIRITDDGRGIDRERVFAKAVEKGLVAADAQMSKEDIDALIFAPGFSTAASITSVSGRGVGMDVVRQNVKELGGRITIESEHGKGTSFTLTLPLTLAISDGMIVNVGDQTLIVPLTHVVESLRPKPGDIQGLGTNQQLLNVRGKFIPVLPVYQAIGAARSLANAEAGVLIVVDTEVAGQAALLVDDICDQRQFVIKSLDTHYRAVEGIAGATILGDGQVALILDVDGLVAGALAHPDRKAA
ncbi:chemotaxis protein CheA [Novosphingobium lentum]|uniref:chemotaxis protein CheA n=1 Tax=Novosphingobium lentum TaxID=145287 RepID=UPI00082E8F2E|nr:chemotaxis protein CheA [Novosphingobium lentum]